MQCTSNQRWNLSIKKNPSLNVKIPLMGKKNVVFFTLVKTLTQCNGYNAFFSFNVTFGFSVGVIFALFIASAIVYVVYGKKDK